MIDGAHLHARGTTAVMATMRGRIILAQESRFVVTDANGIAHLFILSPKAAAEPQQLQPLAARHATVEITYGEAKNVIASQATRIDVIDDTVAGKAL